MPCFKFLIPSKDITDVTLTLMTMMTIKPFHIRKRLNFEKIINILNAVDQCKLKLENGF